MKRDVFARLSVTQKVFFVVFLVLVIALIAAVVLLNGFVDAQMRNTYTDSIRNLFNSFENGVKGSLERGQMINFQHLLNYQKKIKGVVVVHLYDKYGKINLSSNDINDERRLSPEMMKRLKTIKDPLVLETDLGLTIYGPQKVIPDCLRCHPTWEIGDIGGILTLTYSLDTLNKVISRLKIFTMGGSVILLIILSCIIFLVMYKTVNKPIKEVASRLKDIAEGEGDLTKRIEVKTRDEIGELAEWFNIFEDKLYVTIKQVADNTNRLSDSAEKFSSVAARMAASANNMNERSDNIASASQQVSDNVGNMASLAEDSRKSVSDISVMMEEMSSTFSNVTDTSHKTAENVEQMADACDSLSTGIDTVAAAVEEMTASLNETARNTNRAHSVSQGANKRTVEINEKMDGLVKASKQIGKFVNVIKDIADQTNMLALNATIEAAGAGQAGKGFAVVAGEVKELAKQSADLTDEISERIEKIQGSINTAVDVINDISDVIGNIADINHTIASSVEEQTATAFEISHSISGNAKNVKEVAEKASESSRLVNDIALSMDETLKTASDVAVHVDELAQGVTKTANSSMEAAGGVAEISNNIRKINTALKENAVDADHTRESSEKLAEMAAAMLEVTGRFKL